MGTTVSKPLSGRSLLQDHRVLHGMLGPVEVSKPLSGRSLLQDHRVLHGMLGPVEVSKPLSGRSLLQVPVLAVAVLLPLCLQTAKRSFTFARALVASLFRRRNMSPNR